MARKHTWDYKRVDNDYYVVCKDCGVTDKKFDNEDAAKARIMHLKVLGTQPSKLQQHFPKRLF